MLLFKAGKGIEIAATNGSNPCGTRLFRFVAIIPSGHTYCTMLYEAGIDLKTAQRWMGHVDEKKILRIYAHLTERQEQKAVEKLKEFMAG